MKKLQKIIIFALAAFLISACGGDDLPRSRSVEKPAVYSALINEESKDPLTFLGAGEPILIQNSSYFETVEDDYLYDELRALDKDTLEDFKTVNLVSEILDTPLSINKPYEYIVWPGDENEWKEFRQKYPDALAITTLSRVGVNEKRNQALVYMAYVCGVECGRANIYFLVRTGDTWEVKGTVNVWVS